MPRSPVEISSPPEAAEGHRQALENARRHYRCGDLLSEADEHGIATAHMVLAAEEAIKAQVLLFVSLGLGVELPPKALRAFLTQHLPRQVTGAFWTLIDFVMTRWVRLITSLEEEYPDKTSIEYQKARRNKVIEFSAELNVLADANPGESRLVDAIIWWGKSDDLKQRGLYVDFRDHLWLGPYSVTKEEFNAARDNAEEIIRITEQTAQAALSDTPRGRQELVEKLNQLLQKLKREREAGES